ncbi:hypothetical protein [Actinoplanes regularis]|uniref:hypothetical protein n=1 Tax=Actinoplanes regularis TaxID=52697 RepID=UPI0024A30A3C|nr:hypothetical protein [Actinoplanes regularis]GLW32236.1 hypothetical protein Areg01_51750 [Actinoplanes regularis]
MNERQYGDRTDGAGEATLDLSRRLRGDPESAAVAEARIRARGRHLILGGSVLTLISFAVAVVWHVGFGSMMPAAYITPLYLASGGGIVLGCLEYITRHSRAQQALALQISLRVQADQLRLVGLLSEELQQRYYVGAGDMLRDQAAMQATGTGPVVGRAPAARSGGDVVELRRRTET